MSKQDISNDLMTIGQLAKIMKTTVRTLQYYDKKGLLSPTTKSIGGRRLYNYKDMIKLHQIQTLKSLGFSLDEIENNLVSLDTPNQVIDVLNKQATLIKDKITKLEKTLTAIETLKTEVLQMKTVDFKKYADIIVNLQMDNEYYWLIKHFDNETLEHIRQQFDKDSGQEFIQRFHQLNEDILELKAKHLPPEDEQVQQMTGQFWNLIMEFTQGDMSLLPRLMKFDHLTDAQNQEWIQKQNEVNDYLKPALEIYFQKLGYNPFVGE